MRLRILLTLTLVAQALFASQASARLKFSMIEDPFPVIAVIGTFSPDDDFREFDFLARHKKPSGVLFHSPGGTVIKAMQLGRRIRSYGLNTIVIDGLRCESACAFAFLGGVRRLADAGTIGIHKSSLSQSAPNLSPDQSGSLWQTIMAEMMAYVGEMGVDSDFLALAMRYEHHDMRYLSASEMRRMRVTTVVPSKNQFLPQEPKAPPLAKMPEPKYSFPFKVPDDGFAASNVARLPTPAIKLGLVRHPRGQAAIKAESNMKSAVVVTLANRTPVRIDGSEGDWYRVSSPQGSGYMHHTWLMVEQQGAFEDRYVQIKSVTSLNAARDYVRSFPMELSVFRTVNGWFAITLKQSFSRDGALEAVNQLRTKQAIPDDSFITYGNTYVSRVCCGREQELREGLSHSGSPIP